MNTYILLFKGINVGGNNILPMKPLTVLLERCGYERVKTYVQSGNVVLKSDSIPTAQVSEKIEKEFGFKPNLIILDRLQFMETVQSNPFSSDLGKAIHFYFLAGTPSPDSEKIDRLALPTESYLVHENVFYLYAPDGVGRSKLATQVESCLGVAATGRNLNTINKLLTMI